MLFRPLLHLDGRYIAFGVYLITMPSYLLLLLDGRQVRCLP